MRTPNLGKIRAALKEGLPRYDLNAKVTVDDIEVRKLVAEENPKPDAASGMGDDWASKQESWPMSVSVRKREFYRLVNLS